MGFGSYDESEQGKTDVQTEESDEEDIDLKQESEHDGDVEFEMEDTQSALEKLSEMRDS